MDYRAQVRLDFDGMDRNEYQKLVAALMQLGWQYVQTSSFAVETPELAVVLRAFEVLAKQVTSAGTLSGLSFDVQGSEDFNGIRYAAAANHPYALEQVQAKPIP